MVPPLHSPLEDRTVYLRLPGSTWTYLWELALIAITEERADEEAWRARSRDEQIHVCRLLLALREVVRQSAPATLDQAVADVDELQVQLFAACEFVVTPEDLAFMRELVIDTEKQAPAAIANLMRLLEEGKDPRNPK